MLQKAMLNIKPSSGKSHFSKTIIILFLFLILPCHYLLAQREREEPPPLRERLFFGGNFALQFGTITNIQLSPVVGIWLLPRLAVAAGPDYRFYKYSYDKTNIFGGKIYTELVLIQNLNSIIPIGGNTGIFLHLEDEFLSLETEYWKNPPYNNDRFTINTLLAGGGISQQIGRRSSMNFMVLWALNESIYDVYGTPEIRISFNF
jgi:hypothetical protein